MDRVKKTGGELMTDEPPGGDEGPKTEIQSQSRHERKNRAGRGSVFVGKKKIQKEEKWYKKQKRGSGRKTRRGLRSTRDAIISSEVWTASASLGSCPAALR